ncbi:MAG: tetratricopeptide repeat protein [Spirochaetaceae bacterium]|jgi:tetratricopeptide (TPR) repeat protein|nr:tetratricopeptide repeat protein [Spirochaetaceae bacterium]
MTLIKKKTQGLRHSIADHLPLVFIFIPAFSLLLLSSCLSSSAKAEEYYSLGMAYFELKKYPQAENWFNKSKYHSITKTASEYNLGRIAYETGRYREARRYFERIIGRDRENVTALKAAAYTCIKLEEFDKAEDYYRRILGLVPESYDEGYNYALVLMALGRAGDAESVLIAHTDILNPDNNTENAKALLLLARAQKEQGKPEAADTYNACLQKEDNPVVRAEYAAYLAENGHTDKALKEYRLALENSKLTEAKKKEIQEAITALETDGEGDSKVQQDAK